MTSQDIPNSLSLVWTERLPDRPDPLIQETAAIAAEAEAMKAQYEALQRRAVAVIGQIYNTWTLPQIAQAQQVSI